MDELLDTPLPTLPPGYQAEELLRSREQVWVLRARLARDGREESVLLRLDTSPRAAEGLAELAVLAAVEHPGIAHLIDHGPLPGGGLFVARDWVEGQNLAAWAEQSSQSPEETGSMIARLTPALDHLHHQGFIHADLKPQNVIVNDDGLPILVDFGLARERGAYRSEDGVSGSFYFLSPEELMGLELTPLADLFALGAMLHQLVAPVGISPRDFYARFPESSFLDASGTDPESLPEWSRDLIVGLTARDPDRRPKSAGAAGRALANRLGVDLDRTQFKESMRWPIALGREAWIAEWTDSLDTDPDPSTWIRLPRREDPRPFWAHMRLHAALRGRRLRGVDLLAELRNVTDGVALDRWAAEIVDEGPEWIAVLAGNIDPWSKRALLALDRAAHLVRAKAHRTVPIVFFVSSEAPVSGELAENQVPSVDASWVRGFVGRHFPAEQPERADDFADRLSSACSGSATRLDEIFLASEKAGWIFDSGEGYRLRPGDLGDPATLLADADPLGSLDAEGADLLLAVDVCAGRSDVRHLIRLLGGGPGFGATLIALRQAGWVDVIHRTAYTEVVRRRSVEEDNTDLDRLRTLHEKRAAILDEEADESARAALHRLLSKPDPERCLAMKNELVALLDRGRPEAGLEIGDRLNEGAHRLGIDLVRTAPEVLIERARLWCAIGHTEMALREIENVELVKEPRSAALIEVIRGLVASLQHETDAALEHYQRAIQLHASVTTDATIGRIQLLHTLGKDEEVCTLVDELKPEKLEERGEMLGRHSMYVRSLQAMSAMRLGRVDEARACTTDLIEKVRKSEDVQLEAALHINLAIIERLGGSLTRAREEFEESIRLYDRAGITAGLAHARATLGGLLRELGELVDAEPLLISAMEMRERLNDPKGAGTARGMLALLYFERGHTRAAIETLESTAGAMSGAQERRHAPLLVSKAIEMRNRIGDVSKNSGLPTDDESVDPRILLARSRIAWMSGNVEEALALAERAASLSESLKQDRLAHEAHLLAGRLSGKAPESAPSTAEDASLGTFDERIFELLVVNNFDPGQALALAMALGRRGCDDRAARLWFALSARCDDLGQAKNYRTKAEEYLDLCTSGLTVPEANSFRSLLLGEPDPWPGDFTIRSDDRESDEEFEMEVLRLLDINKQLVQQQDLDSLLGVIVEHALAVTGAERGFLVLEKHGELRFDTAMDSCRGDIAQPEFEISGSAVREALDRMEPLRISNAVDDPALAQQTSVVSLELRSILCVPFAISDELRGAIYVDHRLRKGAFDENSEKLCALLANQAAVAIQQIKRMEEIRDLNRELERRVVQKETDLQNARRALREAGAAEPGRLIGKSPVIHKIQELLAKYSTSDLSVLIIGESGTGKEVAAHSLHEQSLRSRASFVSENCAALPASLIESELFGHRKGAFTGADRNRAGLFEQADGGTLFLDEIGELPPQLQPKFLRVLETGEVRRIGDEESRTVDFRLIVATNRNLEKEVREGRFRQDLFFRLDGLRIQMPTLAERPEDTELLVEHFLRQEEARGGPKRRISKRVLSALARRNWPGNVRELRNEISRLCVLCEGDVDDPSLISRPASLASDVDEQHIIPIIELERRAIRKALEQTGGDKRRAAEMLGISRAKIYQRLKEWRRNGEGPAEEDED